MREIKFRGKRLDNGEWVYGYYVINPDRKHRIYLKPFEGASSNTYYFVDPSTVGQYTGVKDKDGKEIWEGDILISIHGNRNPTPIKFGEFLLEEHGRATCVGFYWDEETDVKCPIGKDVFDRYDYLTVVGNIHENG